MNEQQHEEKKASLRLEILDKLSTLVTAGLGLVAALAWNSAIQDAFAFFFPNRSALWAKFGYALFITIVVVVLATIISRSINKLKQKLGLN